MIWAPTGWRPTDVAQRYPVDKSDLSRFEKYDPKLSMWTKYAVIGQYFLLSIFHFWSMEQEAKLPYELLFAVVITQLLTVMVIGALLDGKPLVRGLELSRLVVMTGILVSAYTANIFSMEWLYYGIVYLVVSASLMWVCIKREWIKELVASSNPA